MSGKIKDKDMGHAISNISWEITTYHTCNIRFDLFLQNEIKSEMDFKKNSYLL